MHTAERARQMELVREAHLLRSSLYQGFTLAEQLCASEHFNLIIATADHPSGAVRDGFMSIENRRALINLSGEEGRLFRRRDGGENKVNLGHEKATIVMETLRRHPNDG
jgi:hypothetical protein